MDFKFDITKLLRKAQKIAQKHINGLTITLPFISFSVTPEDIEKKVARELMIRLSDKRVLNAKECCDDCIDNALASLQEIRKILVNAQVELSDYHEGALYLLVELMAEGIRQFLTIEESLKVSPSLKEKAEFKDLYRSPDIRQQYFSILEKLRFHIHSCLSQVAIIADMETPKIESYLKSNEQWMLSLYKKPTKLLKT